MRKKQQDQEQKQDMDRRNETTELQPVKYVKAENNAHKNMNVL